MEFEVKETKRVKRTYKDKAGVEQNERRTVVKCASLSGAKLSLDMPEADAAPSIGDKLTLDTTSKQGKLE